MIELAVINTDDEIELYKLKKEPYYARCPRKKCHHKWKTDVGSMLENNSCPKCKSEL